MQPIPELSRAANMLKAAFERWAKKHPIYAAVYKKIPSEVIGGVGFIALEELPYIKPGAYDFWWAKNHVRFMGEYRQKDLSLLHELMYHFLTAFSRGQLGAEDARGKDEREKKALKTKTRPEL